MAPGITIESSIKVGIPIQPIILRPLWIATEFALHDVRQLPIVVPIVVDVPSSEGAFDSDSRSRIIIAIAFDCEAKDPKIFRGGLHFYV